MNLSQEKALYHLTGQTESDPGSLKAVQAIAEAYPYFAPAQCLLACQFKKEEHPMVVLQTLKTALYFTNPYWLQYQLYDNGAHQPKLRVEQLQKALAEQTVKEEEKPLPPLPVEPIIIKTEEPVVLTNNIPPANDLHVVQEEKTAVDPIPEPETVTKPDFNPYRPAEEPEPDVPSFQSNMAIPTIEAVREMMRKIDQSPATEAETEANDTTVPEGSAEGFEEDSALQTDPDSKIASLLSNQLADFKKPVDEDDKLEIETVPEKMFMVDYFASQGIKIDLSAIPQDKLTTHLLKFTDWLRQMKQGSGQKPKDLVANIQMELAVAQTAQISNESREVVTEAMAEVLEKQGQAEKAIQLYIKLSFLNPEKSSYFAAKIEQLKGI